MITASLPNCFYADNSVKELMKYFDEEGVNAKQLYPTETLRLPDNSNMEVTLVGFAPEHDPTDYEFGTTLVFPVLDLYDMWMADYLRGGEEVIEFILNYDYPDYVTADILYDRVLSKLNEKVTDLRRIKELYEEAFGEEE